MNKTNINAIVTVIMEEECMTFQVIA